MMIGPVKRTIARSALRRDESPPIAVPKTGIPPADDEPRREPAVRGACAALG